MKHSYLLHHYLQSSAEHRPDAPAVVDRDRMITYAELEGLSNRLAHLLIGKGMDCGDRVGIYLDKSIEAVAAIYGVLKAGGVYVPLDTRAPIARLAYITRDCGIRILISSNAKAANWSPLATSGAPLESVLISEQASHVELLDQVRVESFQDLPVVEGPPPVNTIDLDLAYILYTSGSTGAPKGVKLSHRNGRVFVDWAVEEFGVQASDRLSSHAPFHFDLSIFDLFAAAKVGAPTVLVPYQVSFFPVEVARFIRDQAISIWYSVPSILAMLTEYGDLKFSDLPSLRLVLFAGEVFPSQYLSRLVQKLPHAEFCNLYGPTETNVCTYCWVVKPVAEDDPPMSIGRAIANVDTFVVTDDRRRASPGEIGELYVRGAPVMAGYWGDSERTAERLVVDPFRGEVGGLVYRTGDLVEEQPDGSYRFLGRRDNQIKSRGYRIELGEIETALYSHPLVAECAVVAIPDEMVTNRITAFVVLRGDVAVDQLARSCQDRLPRYMIPERFEVRSELPRTSTGKIDRQRLATEASGR